MLLSEPPIAIDLHTAAKQRATTCQHTRQVRSPRSAFLKVFESKPNDVCASTAKSWSWVIHWLVGSRLSHAAFTHRARNYRVNFIIFLLATWAFQSTQFGVRPSSFDTEHNNAPLQCRSVVINQLSTGSQRTHPSTLTKSQIMATPKRNLESSVGITQETADKVRLFASGTHVSIQAIYGDILPVAFDFFYNAEKGDIFKHTKEIKAYLRISDQPENMIMDFVESAVKPIPTNHKAKTLTSFLTYLIVMGSERIRSKMVKSKAVFKAGWLDEKLILRKVECGSIIDAVERVVDYFSFNEVEGVFEIKNEYSLARERRQKADLDRKIFALLEAVYLRLLVPGKEESDVILQHLFVSSARQEMSSHSGMDSMTEGILLHLFVLRVVALESAWRASKPVLGEPYDMDAIMKRYQKAKSIIETFTRKDLPSVYRTLSEWA